MKSAARIPTITVKPPIIQFYAYIPILPSKTKRLISQLVAKGTPIPIISPGQTPCPAPDSPGLLI